MSKEIILSKHFLALRVNGHSVPTEKGQKAQVLRLSLKALDNKNQLYALSPEFRNALEQKVALLSNDPVLELPKDEEERKKQIAEYDRELTEAGIPPWKVYNIEK